MLRTYQDITDLKKKQKKTTLKYAELLFLIRQTSGRITLLSITLPALVRIQPHRRLVLASISLAESTDGRALDWHVIGAFYCHSRGPTAGL